jgi:hypothetical protein
VPKKKNSLPPVNWRWVEEGDGYVGRLQPSGQPLGVGRAEVTYYADPARHYGMVAASERGHTQAAHTQASGTQAVYTGLFTVHVLSEIVGTTSGHASA